MKINRNGYYQLLDASGTQISRHTDVKEAYERASELPAGSYTIVQPQLTIEVERHDCPVVPDPPVDPEPEPEPEPEPVGRLVVDLSYASKTTPEYSALIALVDSELAGGNNYGFSALDAVVAYRLSGDQRYRELAVSIVDKQVMDAEVAIAAGNKPAVAGDSYLEIGPMLSALAQTYQYCSPSDSQRARWKVYADQAVANVWFFQTAKWGSKAWPGNGWGANDPGNNYFHSFCLASVMWALASNNTATLDYLKNNRFPMLGSYFDNLVGGGSREGTGYGLSARTIYEFMAAWRDSGYAVPASVLRHAKDSVTYWAHATQPGRDRYSPIGDLARESMPYLMEYHVELVMRAAWLAGDAQTRQLAGYWARNVVRTPNNNRTWARRNALFAPATGGADPSSLVYHAAGVGNLFARTGWGSDAVAVTVVAGPFDQSHAAQEQGGFTYWNKGFAAVTANIFSRSGINQDVTSRNVLRFSRAGGNIGQRRADAGVSAPLQNLVIDGGNFTAASDLKAVYPDSGITAYRRSYSFAAGALEVTDDYSVASNVAATFQVCTPALPQINGNVAVAGTMRVTVIEPANATLTVVTDPQGEAVNTTSYRLDVNGGVGRYKVRLERA